MNVVKAIVKRELRSWFGSPAAYVFITMFALVCALALFSPDFFQANLASLDTLNTWFPYIVMFLIPAITMSIWAGERGQGTDELLLTLPATDGQIVLGKYVAGATIYSLILLFTIPQLIVLAILGAPDWSQVFANYFAYWLLGVTLVGAGMLGSQLSDNLTVAFILGVIFCGMVVFLEKLLGYLFPGLGGTLTFFPIALFEEMGTGIISLSAFVLFAGLVVAFYYANLLLLSRRHWRGAEGGHRSIRFASLIVIACGLTLLVGHWGARVDATSGNIHSLSEMTEDIITGLDQKRPVVIQAFVSPEVPRDYVQTRRDLLNLLREYDSMGGDAVRVRIVDTERYSPEAQLAKEKFGIEPQAVFVEDENGRRQEHIFLGVAFTSGLEESVIPFLYNKLPVEYELTRSIRTVAQAKRRKLGILRTDVNLLGGFDPATMRPSPEWEIVKELELQYEVEQVSPDDDYPEDLDVLLAPMASSLTQEQMDRLDAHIKGGGPTILIDDPLPLAAPGTGPSDPKGGGRRNPMMGMGQPPPGEKGDFVGLLAGLGIDWPSSQISWDRHNPHPELEAGIDPEIVFVGSQQSTTQGDQMSFNPTDPITSGLQEVVVMFGGVVRKESGSSLEFVPLLRGSEISGTVAQSEVMTRDFFGTRLNPNRRLMRAPHQTLACRVHGKIGTVDVSAVFIPDLDMVSEQFFELRRRRIPGLDLNFDNVPFVLNCVDALAGDDSFIALRKRRPLHRTLTTIDEKQREYQDRWLAQKEKAELGAKEAMSDAQKRLDEAVESVRKSTELDETSKQIKIESIREVEQRRLDVASAKIDDEKDRAIDGARATRVEQQRKLRRSYATLGWVISPLLSVIVGLIVLVSRFAKERDTVPGDRSTGGAS